MLTMCKTPGKMLYRAFSTIRYFSFALHKGRGLALAIAGPFD
jgi:hypothetical protein